MRSRGVKQADMNKLSRAVNWVLEFKNKIKIAHCKCRLLYAEGGTKYRKPNVRQIRLVAYQLNKSRLTCPYKKPISEAASRARRKKLHKIYSS